MLIMETYGRLSSFMHALIFSLFFQFCSYVRTSPEDINKMYRAASGSLISLRENPRSETLSWHTYVHKVFIVIKKNRETKTTNV